MDLFAKSCLPLTPNSAAYPQGVLTALLRRLAQEAVRLGCRLSFSRSAVDLSFRFRRSAHLGGLNLTNSNKNVRSRTSAALAAVREAADHRLLDARTQGTRARAPVKVRPQKSHGQKLERCAKLRKVSDLMHAEDGVGRDGAVTAFWSST